MNTERPLRGSCSCGRNSYTVSLPQNAADVANVFFDSGSESRRILASPLTAWLRVPLSCFQSSTTSFYPDETHTMIRKSFSSSREPNAKRIFCGYCGTHLTYWCERPETEANYLNVTVGSLFGDDIRILEQLGLLRTSKTEESPSPEVLQLSSDGAASPKRSEARDTSRDATSQGPQSGGLEWMEEIITGTWLGKYHQTSRGVGVNAAGLTHIEWEITEIGGTESGSEKGAGRVKRKLDEVGTSEDAPMHL